MAEERFDLSYIGELAPGADPTQVRERLTAVFKLSEDGGKRLFTGRPVIVKRDADARTKARFETVFNQAGAVLRATPVTMPEQPTASAPPTRTDLSAPEGSRARGDVAPPLALTTQGGFLEAPRTVNIAAFDTSGLSLVSDPDWSLEDCEPPLTPTPIPDIGYLSLAEMEPPTERPRTESREPPD
jgi:hypothetical protein